MPDFTSLPAILAGFVAVAAVIVLAGVKLAGTADRLADRTGMGEAMAGGLLLGAATSLAGLTTSISAAWNGFPELAVSNAAGGIAGQTFFLVIADMTYRRANLEHAAASMENLLQCTLLMTCLGICLLAISVPGMSVWGVHPLSLTAAAFYLFGLMTIDKARQRPGWRPRRTTETRSDEPDPDNSQKSLIGMSAVFVVLALTTAVAGYILSKLSERAITEFGWSEALVGTFATALITSLPELVTTVAAVRRGALTLAVAGIIGGNSFDTMFLVASDVAYREGPIWAAVTPSQNFLIVLSVVMSGILLMGLIRREKQGPGRLGFETILLLIAYLGGSAVLVAMG